MKHSKTLRIEAIMEVLMEQDSSFHIKEELEAIVHRSKS